jgi:hypothetical protein
MAISRPVILLIASGDIGREGDTREGAVEFPEDGRITEKGGEDAVFVSDIGTHGDPSTKMYGF